MAEIQKLGARHLADVNFEVQRTNNFEIQVDIPGVSQDRIRTLTLAVVGGFLPNESNEVIALNYGNTQITVAGAARVNGSGTLTVRDLVQQDTEILLDQWRASVYDKDTDAIHFASDYKKSARVIQSAPDGTYVRVWDLEGVWPSAVDYGTVSYDSPGVKTVSVTLQYDKARVNRNYYHA